MHTTSCLITTLESQVSGAYAQPVGFGKNVKRIRLNLDMKQKALAARLGVNQATVSGWESDKRGVPEGPTLLRFAKALGCSIDELLLGVDPEYDEIVIGRRDPLRHDDAGSSAAARNQAQRKGSEQHGVDGATATRVQQHHLKARTTFIRDLQDVADELFKLVTVEEERIAREGGDVATHAARRRRHHRKAG